MAAVLVKSTNFAAAGPVSAVSANATLYDGLRDKAGSIYSITGAAGSSRLGQVTSALTRPLYLPIGANALRDTLFVAYLDGPANSTKLCVRCLDDGTGKPSENGYYLIVNQANLVLQYFSPGTPLGTLNLDSIGWNLLTGALVVAFECVQEGTNVTRFRVRCCTRANWNAVANPQDNLGSVTWAVNYTRTHDLSAASGADLGRYQGAGWCYIGQVPNAVASVERVDLYDTAAPLSRGRLVTTYLDDVKAVLSCTNQGGAQPITKRHHAIASIPTNSGPIAATSATEVPGQSGYGSDTLTYTFADDVERVFACKAVDTNGVTTLSNLAKIRRGKKPIHTEYFGDSYTQGLEATFRAPDAAAEFLRSCDPLRTFTYGNRGVSQTSAVAWLPPSDPEYNALGLSPEPGGFISRVVNALAAARAANPNAILLGSLCLGINDANNNGNSPALAVSPSTFAAQLSRVIAAVLNPGVLADRVYIHHPPWVATQNPGEDNSNGGTGSRRAANMLAYRAAVEGLANGTTIRIGDRDGWDLFGAWPQHNETVGYSLPGEGHPHVADTNTGTANLPDGYRQLGHLWGRAIAVGEGILSSGGIPGRPFNSPIFGG